MHGLDAGEGGTGVRQALGNVLEDWRWGMGGGGVGARGHGLACGWDEAR